MTDTDNNRYRQMYFDMNGEIHQETYVYHRQMTAEEQEQYDKMVQDANQMTIFDFLQE